MNNSSLEDLLINEMKIIYRYLVKLGASHEDAEDIIQDSLCKAITNISSIDDGKLKSWLFKVSINNYYNLYKKKKMQRKHMLINKDMMVELLGDTLSDEVLRKERIQNVYKTLDQLKASYKELLEMKYIMEFSYKEISELLGIDESKVKTYLYRARLKFKQLWEASIYGQN